VEEPGFGRPRWEGPVVERVGVVGTGLIGGSLGLAVRKRSLAREVLGYDADPGMAEEAERRGAVTRRASLEELATACGLVFLAVPVRAIPEVLGELAPHLREGALVTDVGSVKGPVVRRAAELVPPGRCFIGGHPMAGSERRGVEFADPDLFQEAYYILTPSSDCPTEAYSFLHTFLSSLGARVLAMDPGQHDRAVAVISHLPHLLAMGLMNLVLDRAEEYPLLKLAAGGFRDVTRIAASDPRLWLDILVENREAVLSTLDSFAGTLSWVRELLAAGDEGALLAFLERASRGRAQLVPALREQAEELYYLTVAVENRPGVISAVTMALGERGINIEDLDLVHPLESGAGLLRLAVRGEGEAREALQALRERGFRSVLSRAVEPG